MKYWIFQNTEVCGPYDAAELMRLPGFSAEALVCPEGRKGTSVGDWQRAGMLPELAECMNPPAPELPSAAPAPAAPAVVVPPPEPTLKDLATLAALQEKIGYLEGAAARFQEEFAAKDAELLSLHREIDTHKEIEEDLRAKIQDLETRLAPLSDLRKSVEETSFAEKSVETEVQGLENALEEQQHTITGLTEKIEQLEIKANEPPPAPKIEPPAPVPAAQPPLPAVSLPEPAPMQDQPTPVLSQGPVTAPVEQPSPANAPASFFPGEAEKSPFFQASPTPTSDRTAQVPPLTLGISPAPAPQPQFPKAPAGQAMLEELTAPTPEKPKSGKKGMVFAVLFLGLAGGGYYAFQAGLIPGLNPPAPPAPVVPPPAPAPQITPQAPSPEAKLEELKNQAIELVKSWPTAAPAVSVGQNLMPSTAASEGLSPWMAERLKDDNSFQVNFYGGKSATGQMTVYEFQANLGDKTVAPLNETAKILLQGKPAAPKIIASSKKKRVRTKRPKSLKSLPGFNGGSGPAAAAAPAANEPARPAPPGDAVPAASVAETPPAPEPDKKPAKKEKPVKEADDAKLLDDLLQP